MPAQSITAVILRDGNEIQRFDLQTGLVIGRGPSATVQIADTSLSREHAAIVLNGDQWSLEDRSSYGTFLDGQKLERGALAPFGPNSVARMGNLEVRFTPAHESAASRSVDPAAPIERTPIDLEPSPLLEDLVERQSEIPIWSKGTIDLKIVDIIDETVDTKTFRMVGTKPVLFSFKPGQFVTLNIPIDGKTVKRSYSISSSPSRPHTLELTVKRVPGGLVSNWMCDELKLGDVLNAKGPAGKFTCFGFPERKLLFIGAGSGITPVMSMLRWVVDTAADVDAYLFVSARTPHDIIFRNELNWMSSRHSGIRVGITCTGRPSGAEAWTGITGRCSGEMLQMMVPDLMERHAFMCGPEPFMDSVTDGLRSVGYPIEHLHSESFGGARVVPDAKVEPRDVVKNDAGVSLSPEAFEKSVAALEVPVDTATFQVTFAKSGVTVTTAGEADILELAEANGVDEIDYACRSGSCGQCVVKCSSGTVEMDEDCAIDDDEKAEGMIYACCSIPTSDVVIDV